MKAHIFPEEIVCTLMARELGRPVKWTEDRRENLTASYHAKDIIVTSSWRCARTASSSA